MTTDGDFAFLENQRLAKDRGIVNIVFNKIVGSLKNLISSEHRETRLKKWRGGTEPIMLNLKKGFDLFRCAWRTRAHFDTKVSWSVIAYNIRVITSMLIGRMQTAR